VRFVGDPIAAVGAETPALAAAALAGIVVDLDPLPWVTDPDAALAPDAPHLHPSGNLLHSIDYRRGDLDAAFAAALHVVDDVYLTGRQMHGFLETEGGMAEPDGQGGLLVHVGSHHAAGDQRDLAVILGLDPGRIRVISGPTGGSFGGKDGMTIQPIACLLALRTGRPVRLHYTRPESAAVGVKRHAFRIHMRTACDGNGRLLAHQVDLLADTGAYATHGAEVLDTAAENASGAYAFDAVRLTGRMVYTNNGIAGAFRGFGATQTQFALERQITRLAELAGLDPAEFRARNLRPPGGLGGFGQIMTQPCHPSHALQTVRNHPLWTARKPPTDDRFLVGTGLALVTKSEGFAKGGPNGGRLGLRLLADGAIEIAGGGAELGQGAVAAAQALAVAALGCDATDIRVVLGDSSAPDTGMVAASRMTGMLHRGVALAAPLWRTQVLARAALALDITADLLALGPGGVWLQGGNAPAIEYSALARDDALGVEVDIPPVETKSDVAAHADFVSCGAIAAVRVDRWTGRVTVDRLVMAPACGPVVVPQSFLGQVEGGAVMGLGLALLEDLPVADCRYTHLNFDGYVIPSLADAPPVDVLAIEHLDPGDAIGPRGVGEIIINAAVAAIANAVAQASGKTITRIPIRPADLL
jgi:CO/xanthine dehydrogenase Mo-binding subunit